MNKKIAFCAMAAVLLTVGCSKDDDLVVPVDPVETDTVYVAMVLPGYIQKEWSNSINLALRHLEKAQNMEKTKTVLKLSFYDEDKENLDALAYRLTHPEEGDDTCHAIVGPYHSYNAPVFLSYASQNRTPVVMPTCSSADLQRVNARNTYAWFMTESDVTQCEIMLQAVKSMSDDGDVALLYSDDNYGKSFYDWFGYWSVELGLHSVGGAGKVYKKGDNIKSFIANIDKEGSDTHFLTLCLALSDPQDYLDVLRQIEEYQNEIWQSSKYNDDVYLLVTPLMTDVAYTDAIISDEELPLMYGITPIGSPGSGYVQAYMQDFGKVSTNGDAQVYDALTIIAMGAALKKASPDVCLVDGKQVVYDTKPYEPGLTDYMRSVVNSGEGPEVNWTSIGLAQAFHELHAGRPVDVEGATGSLLFDDVTNTKILDTTYMLWTRYTKMTEDGGDYQSILPVCYLSTGGTSGSASTKSIWEQQKLYEQQFDKDLSVDHALPLIDDYWAVVISPSTTWANYRHQADAFAMYQTLRHNGYDDDHIILIVEDNLYNYKDNKFPGQIFVERSDDPDDYSNPFINDDVRSHAVVDYHFSELNPDDITDIMMGRQSERLPQVIHPTAGSNVFFFWSGHGGNYDGPLWGNENAREYFGSQRIRSIVDQMNRANMYRRMMFSIETCFSGIWGQALTGTPDVLVLTAANAIESSKADVHDSTLGVFLSNAFARTFRIWVNNNNEISIHNLYTELAKTTNGSHVSIYNEANYGSVFTNTMEDFFPGAYWQEEGDGARRFAASGRRPLGRMNN